MLRSQSELHARVDLYLRTRLNDETLEYHGANLHFTLVPAPIQTEKRFFLSAMHESFGSG